MVTPGRIITEMTCSSISLGAFGPLNWDPSASPLSGVTFHYDIKWGGGVGTFASLALQDGSVYARGAFQGAFTDWTPYTDAQGDAAWCLIQAADACTESQGPDFSVNGAPVVFGIGAQAVYASGANSYAEFYVDNFQVDVMTEAEVDPTPEPATIGLLALGLSAVGAARFRRKRAL